MALQPGSGEGGGGIRTRIKGSGGEDASFVRDIEINMIILASMWEDSAKEPGPLLTAFHPHAAVIARVP